MSDLNSTIFLTEDQILKLIDNRLFESLDSIISVIDVLLGVVLFGITVFLVITGLKYISVIGITNKIKDEVSMEINQKFNMETKMIEDDFNSRLQKHLKYNMKEYKKEAQKEEFIRNIIFKHLSELLADEIRVNGDSNLKEVFNLYSDRLFLISQLTSNDEKEVKKSLKKLSTGTYDKILRLEAFKEYLNILENKIDMDIVKELYEVKKAILNIK